MSLATRLFRALGYEPRRPRRRQYEGATMSRLTSSWVTSGTSADAEIHGSISRLRNRARQLVRDSDYARQAKRAVMNNVIGTGIKLQAQVMMQRGGRLDEDLNKRIEKAWKYWGYKSYCDVAGRLCFADIERMIVGAMCESGEVFVRVIRRPFGGSQIPFALQIIESDQLDETYTGKSSANGNEWRMGVEVDQFGRAVQYAFLQKHPGDAPFSGTAGKRHLMLQADEVMHLYIQERPGQTRGVTWFASAIKRLHHLAGYEEAEVIRARASSSLMGFITTTEGELGTAEEVYDSDRVDSFAPGVFKYLQPGESVTVPSLDAPDGQFEPFTRGMLRAVAAGLGTSYESVSRDYSQSNYSSSRLAMLEDRDNWRSIQRFLIENFHQPVFNMWLEMAVMGGALDLPAYEANPERYRNIKWCPRAYGYVDPQKEVAAYKAAVRCGFKTLADVVAEQGGDLDDLLKQRQAELAMLDEMNIVLDTDPSEVNGGGGVQPGLGMGAIPAFDDTERPGEQEQQEPEVEEIPEEQVEPVAEQEVTEDGDD